MGYTAVQHAAFPSTSRDDAHSVATPATYMAGGLLTMYLIVNEANFRVRDVSDLSLDWQVALRLAVCGACGVFGAVWLFRTIPHFGRWPVVACTLFALWALLTIPFAARSDFAAAACVTLWSTFLFVPAALMHLGAKRFLAVVAACFVIVLAGSWFVHFLLPSVGRAAVIVDEVSRSRLGGLNHPNTTAGQAALALGLTLAFRLERILSWNVVLPLLAFLVMTLALTASRTGILAALGLAALLLIPRGRFLYCALCVSSALAVLFVLIGIGAIDWQALLGSVSRRDGAAEVYRLTGRVDLWGYVWDRITDSPWMGYGYGCARFATAEGPDWATGRHAHNVLLNVMLGTGFIGGAFLLLMLVGLGSHAIFRASPVPDLILLYICINGLTQSPLFHPVPGSPTLLFMTALFWRQLNLSLHDRKHTEVSADLRLAA